MSKQVQAKPYAQVPYSVTLLRATKSGPAENNVIVLYAAIPGIGVTVAPGDAGIIKTGVSLKLGNATLVLNGGEAAYRGVFPVGWFTAEGELCVLMHNASRYSKTFYANDLLGEAVVVKTETVK